MPTPRYTSAHRQPLLMFAAIVLLGAGCSWDVQMPTLEHDEAKTVSLTITGISDEQDREEVQETLKGMTDGSSHRMTSTWSGETMTVKLSPVTDVEAFSRKINFGEVTKVEGRTVHVEYVE